MNEPKPISPTLDVRKVSGSDQICCSGCGYALAPAGQPWKATTTIREMPTEMLAHESATGEPADTVLRLFVCRGCGALLDSETALLNEPFLEDIVTT